MQREKVDFLLAVGEKLCRLSGTESTEHLARVRSGDDHEAPTVDRRWDDAPEEFSAILADMVSQEDFLILLIKIEFLGLFV
jgi:hypothetical protein